MMRVTIVGARGFIGSAIAAVARARGLEVFAVPHDRVPSANLGTLIYCSGLAWGAEKRPLDAFALHTCVPLELLAHHRFDRFLYLSSTRVYDRTSLTQEEAQLCVDPSDPSGTYAVSKIAAEAGLLSASDRTVILRVSNVFGPNIDSNVFLSDIMRQAVQTRRIELHTTLDSSKDYISVTDVADLAVRIATASKWRIYNFATGRNVTNQMIVDAISALIPVQVSISAKAQTVVTPIINVDRIREEFKFQPNDFIAAIPAILEAFRAAAGAQGR